jgi:cation-transporting ATPase I
VHIELRPVDPDQFRTLAARLQERLSDRTDVHWVEALSAIGRVVVSFDEEATSSEELLDSVEAVEEELGIRDHPFPVEAAEDPGDAAPILRGIAELSGDALGTMLSLAGRLTPIRALPAAVDPGLVTSLLSYTPRLRRPIEERLGSTATGVVLALANGVSQGLSGSALGPTLDMAYRSVPLNEAIARRRLWQELEPRLWPSPPDTARCHPQSASGRSRFRPGRSRATRR